MGVGGQSSVRIFALSAPIPSSTYRTSPFEKMKLKRLFKRFWPNEWHGALPRTSSRDRVWTRSAFNHDSHVVGEKWIQMGGLYSTARRWGRTHNANVICVSTSAASAHSEDGDTPMRRTPLRIGNCAASNSALIDANVERSEIGTWCGRLQVMIWKSA